MVLGHPSAVPGSSEAGARAWARGAVLAGRPGRAAGAAGSVLQQTGWRWVSREVQKKPLGLAELLLSAPALAGWVPRGL